LHFKTGRKPFQNRLARFKMSWPILKQVGPFQSRLPAMACFKMGQIKVYLLIGLTSFKIARLAHYKMGSLLF